MFPRMCIVLKEFGRLKQCNLRTFVSIDSLGSAGPSHPQPTTSSSSPEFPRPATPSLQPFANSATDKPPVLDIPPEADPLLAYITSRLMSDGKRHAAARRTWHLLLHLHSMTRSPPLPILREAVFLAAPSIRVVSHKHGGKVVQKPIPLGERQRTRYAVKWMLEAAQKKSGKKIEERLAREVVDIIKQDPENEVLKKKKAVHQLGMVNRAQANVRV